jgi:hypothetical protein
MLFARMRPAIKRSRMKFAVAWMSMADGATGITMQFVRPSISCSTRPAAPAGASITSCRVSSGTRMSKLRMRPGFAGAAFAP